MISVKPTTVKVYEYGVVKLLEGEELIDEQIDLAHRHRNRLTEIELERRQEVQALESANPQVAGCVYPSLPCDKSRGSLFLPLYPKWDIINVRQGGVIVASKPRIVMRLLVGDLVEPWCDEGDVEERPSIESFSAALLAKVQGQFPQAKVELIQLEGMGGHHPPKVEFVACDQTNSEWLECRQWILDVFDELYGNDEMWLVRCSAEVVEVAELLARVDPTSLWGELIAQAKEWLEAFGTIEAAFPWIEAGFNPGRAQEAAQQGLTVDQAQELGQRKREMEGE